MLLFPQKYSTETIRLKSRAANRRKAIRWWNSREDYQHKLENQDNKALTLAVRRSRCTKSIGCRRFYLKAMRGRAFWGHSTEDIYGSTSSEWTRVFRSIGGQRYWSTNHQPHQPRFYCASYDRFDIVRRKQSGALMSSQSATSQVEKRIAYHLGKMERAFNLKVSMIRWYDNGSTNSGGVSAKIEAPFLIFRHLKRTYPIQGYPDNVPDFSYRTQPSGWMDSITFNKWLRESRAIDALLNGQERVLYCDNAKGHTLSSEHLLLLLLSRPFCRMAQGMVQGEETTYSCCDFASVSGKVNHPSREWYMRLAIHCVNAVNNMADNELNISYALTRFHAWLRESLSLSLNRVIFSCHLQCFNCATLKPDVDFQVFCKNANKALKDLARGGFKWEGDLPGTRARWKGFMVDRLLPCSRSVEATRVACKRRERD
eukprot:IDg6178t1